ncbi:MAG: chromate transporter [Erysipelotrichaceae bacterium]|nr:chromate transporter [Erysipelotrichaceae bacterium]
MILLTLYLEFVKIGLFAVGGGLATIPFLADLSEKYAWFTTAELTNMIAVSESTPGPIGINMATYVGYTVHGVSGAIVSTIGIVTPSIIIILLIACLLKNFKDNPQVQRVFSVLRPAVTGLIAAAGFQVFQSTLFILSPSYEISQLLSYFNFPAILLFIILFIYQQKYNRHPIIVIGIAAVCGILFAF